MPFKKYLTYGLSAIFILLIIFANKDTIKTFKEAYGGIGRLTPYQYEAAEWMRQNLPEKADVYITGTAIYTKKKWIQAMSLRHMDWVSSDTSNASYAFVDYSDFALLAARGVSGAQGEIDKLQSWEKGNLINATILYDKNYVKVYELGKD